MTHDYHPHVYAPEAGHPTRPVLADGCPRCVEIAHDPTAHLDQSRLVELLRRYAQGEEPQSLADTVATRNALQSTLNAV